MKERPEAVTPKRYNYRTTPLERAIRRMPRNRPKIIAVWLNGQIVRAQESTHLTRSGVRFNKLIRLRATLAALGITVEGAAK